MDNYIITITRQFGSLGRPIAKKLAEILEINYYDRDIVDMAAKRLNLPVSTVSNEEEKGDIYFNMKFPLGIGTNNLQDDLFKVQANIIKDLAKKESCIIVGRCSDYVLSEFDNLLNIYIYAPYEHRLKNCIELFHMTQKEAENMIKDIDRARDKYHMKYAKYLPDDKEYKDLMIDSSLFNVDQLAEVLADCKRYYKS